MIGIFDSGVGGLTVLKEYLKQYPQYDYMYLGDQENAPYGSHSGEHVNKLVVHNIDFMVKQGCQLIIVACNTASADALRKVQKIYQGKPVILGVLVPAVETALQTTRFGRIGVVGTRGTVESGAYQREIEKYSPTLYNPHEKRAAASPAVFERACPLLVPLVEEGLAGHTVSNILLRNYLRPLKQAHVDTLILGCTHYPLLHSQIQRIMGNQCAVISSAKAAADAIGSYFERHPELHKGLTASGSRRYLTTDCPKRFAELGGRILGEQIKVDQIII
jgi:glutamate racemase